AGAGLVTFELHDLDGSGVEARIRDRQPMHSEHDRRPRVLLALVVIVQAPGAAPVAAGQWQAGVLDAPVGAPISTRLAQFVSVVLGNRRCVAGPTFGGL